MKTLKPILLYLFLNLHNSAYAENTAILNQAPSVKTATEFVVTSEVKLAADSVDQFDWFGGAVSLYGNRALIAADYADGRGSAFVYEYDKSIGQWLEKNRLRTLLYGDFNDDFGNSVSLHGNLALIGAPGDDEGALDSGGAYIFKYDPIKDLWDELPRLSASDREAGDFFGWDVSIHEDKLIVGARFDGEGKFNNLGSAYIFEYNSKTDLWEEKIKLLPSAQEEELRFGEAVSIHGNWAFVGANFDSTNGIRAGVVYVYFFDEKLQQWRETQKLYPITANEYSRFGSSISTDGSKLLIGSPFDSDNGINKGAAYIYEFDTQQQLWLEVQKLVSSDGASSDAFGTSVSLFNDRALIGAFRDDDAGDATGSAYLFGFDEKTWVEKSKLKASDAEAEAYFGVSVAINRDNLLIGAYRDDENELDSGAAYIYSTDLIFTDGLDEFIIDCSTIVYPPGLSQVTGSYRDFNDDHDFGTSTETSFIANVKTSEYFALSNFTMPIPEFRRQLVFITPPVIYNDINEATVSISECPGDFTTSARCIIPIEVSRDIKFSNRAVDETVPNFCVLDSDKSYYFNLIMSSDPLNSPPSCFNGSHTKCAAFAVEQLLQ